MIEIKKLKQLVQLMKDNDLTELDLRDTDQQVTLKRGGEVPPHAHASMPAAPPYAPPHAPPHPPAAPPPEAGGGAPAEPTPEEQGLVEVPSPMVGTFYSAPSPDAEAFVRVGSRIDAETVVCIIEAMKVFNEIPAEVSGTIVAVLLDNEQPVEYGKPLFKVDTSA